MEVTPLTDLKYDGSVQEECCMDSPEASVTSLLPAVLLDDPSATLLWEKSFMKSLLVGDRQGTAISPPADADHSDKSSLDSTAITNLGVNSQSTQENFSFRSFSMQKQGSDFQQNTISLTNVVADNSKQLWSSEEEEANFLASVGLGSIWGINSSETCSTPSTPWPNSLQEDFLIKKPVKVDDTPHHFDQEEGCSNSHVRISSSITEEDSWSMVEDQLLRATLADKISKQPIPWQCIAQALPWKTPLEVFLRTSQLLQSVQRDLSSVLIVTTEQQQQPGISPMSPKQQLKRKRWSEEEHDKFLLGVDRYGWGNWKLVATLIPGRTVPQVTSHAQKCQRDYSSETITKWRRRNN